MIWSGLRMSWFVTHLFRSKFAETRSGLREVSRFFLLSGSLKSFLGLVGALEVALFTLLACWMVIFGTMPERTDSEP
jgi:hypothetical protein